MKTLTLLRHAKSGWDDPAAQDFDRPLNPRGRRAARRVGEEMRIQGLAYDRVLASPAARVVQTLEEVSQSYGPLEITYERALYLGSLDVLLETIRATDDRFGTLLIVGHNPGLENLVLALSRGTGGTLRERAETKYPTACLAELSLAPIDSWRDVKSGSGTLVRFIRPRDLDAELGPEEDGY